MTHHDAGPEVTREDKYHLNVQGVSVVADSDAEARIRDLTHSQRTRFAQIMGAAGEVTAPGAP